MRNVYSNQKVKNQCTDFEATSKLFGGNKDLVDSLYYRIFALETAPSIKDIIDSGQFRFHKLHNRGRKRLEGLFAMDVKTRREPWRLILQPLDENMQPFVPCNIDRIAAFVKIIEIKEISKHYE